MRARTSIAIFGACLAMTVFFTSLVIETHQERFYAPKIANSGAGHVSALNLPSFTYLSRSARFMNKEMGGKGDDKIHALLTQGLLFKDTGNIVGAVELYRSVLARDAQNREALVALGVILFSQHDYNGAEKYLQKFIELEPQCDLMLRAHLGVAQMRQKRFNEALGNLLIVLEKEPYDGPLHFALACIYAELSHPDKAIHHLRRAFDTMGTSILVHISDSSLDSLRAMPEFQDMVQTALREYQRALVRTAETTTVQ